MVDESVTHGIEAQGREAVCGPGGRLRAAREGLGLSQEELARRLHLNVSIIRNLEEDRFDLLPEPAYVRGYLRAAARAVELDPNPLIEALDAQGLREPQLDSPPVVSRASGSSARRGHRKGPYVLGALILLAVTVLIVYGWYERHVAPETQDVRMMDRLGLGDADDRSGGPDPVAREPRSPGVLPEAGSVPEPMHPMPPVIGDRGVEPEPVREPREPVAIPEEGPPLAGVEPPSGPVLDEPEATPEREAVEAAPSDEADPADNGSAPVAAATDDTLEMAFLEDSWAEIHDARGQRLMVGLMREGTERTLAGEAPFRVFLGNAPGVRLKLNQRDYDPSVHVRPDNTARFVLDGS